MPVQYLYPTGIKYSYSPGDWVNQSGHSYTNSNIGINDIDEGIPSNNNDWLKSTSPFFSEYYRLYLLSDQLLVEPESITFRMSYYYSGYLVDSPPIDEVNIVSSLLDKNGQLIGRSNEYYDSSAVANWSSLEENETGYDGSFDFNQTSILIDLVGFIDIGGSRTPAPSSGHIISAIEIMVSGDNVRTSGIPLYTESYYYKNVCIKPQELYGYSSKWTTGYNYDSNFDLGYFRIEEGSGTQIRSSNTQNISGLYYSTYLGNQSGLYWHNKRMSFNKNTTYGHAPKFNSINDSAIIFNSGVLYNQNNFTIFGRYFPSGTTFEENGSGGYLVLLNESLQDHTGDYNFKVETSGYTTFGLTMFDNNSTPVSTNVSIDGSMGFDMVVGFSAPSGYLYIQNHNGQIASGIMSIASIRKDHRSKLSIGGLLPSGQ